MKIQKFIAANEACCLGFSFFNQLPRMHHHGADNHRKTANAGRHKTDRFDSEMIAKYLADHTLASLISRCYGSLDRESFIRVQRNCIPGKYYLSLTSLSLYKTILLTHINGSSHITCLTLFRLFGMWNDKRFGT